MTRWSLVLPALVTAHAAHGEVNRCASGDVDVRYQHSQFDQMTGDTGWFPQGYDAQLRLTGRIAAETNVAMGLRPTACWPGAMMATVPGRAGTGSLEFAYGAELHLFGRIHTSVLGYDFDWDGELPIPTDFLLGKTTAFDPTLLPGSKADHVSGSDTTSPLMLLWTNQLSDYIAISGITGGLHLDAVGSVTTTYATTSVTVASGALATATAVSTLAAPSSGYGAALDLPVAAAGTLHYVPTLTFNVGFNVRILGVPVADYTISSLTMALPQFDSEIILTGPVAHIPLPKTRSLDGARVDFASGATQSLAIHNSGEGPLMIEATSLPAGVSAAPVTIAPGSDGGFALVAAATFSDHQDAVLATNDPSQASVTITLGRDIGGTGLPEEVGCGCNAITSPADALALILMFAGLRRRRRRRRS